MTVPRVFGMGACLLAGPLSEGIRIGSIGRSAIGRGGPTPGTYSFGEMFQLLDFLDGRIDISERHRAICGYRETYEPGTGAYGFSGADVCLIEPNGVVDAEWEGLCINRAQIQAMVINKVKPIGRDVAKAANTWYNKGLLACNDDVRTEQASQIVAQMPADFEDREFIADVLVNARGTRRDVKADIAALVERIPVPIGIVAYAYQYLPDGRPMFWPADLQEQIKAAIAPFGLPYLEPWKLVMEHGGEAVLKPDLRHYREEFIPTVTAMFARFAEEVAQSARVTT